MGFGGSYEVWGVLWSLKRSYGVWEDLWGLGGSYGGRWGPCRILEGNRGDLGGWGSWKGIETVWGVLGGYSGI